VATVVHIEAWAIAMEIQFT